MVVTTEAYIVKLDQGQVNARILAREVKADFRRVEAAGVQMPVRLCSADGKRIFVRSFHSFQLNAHFISRIARTRLDDTKIRAIEAMLRTSIDTATTRVDAAIDEAERLFAVHGVTNPAHGLTLPMDLTVWVLSSSGRRYCEAIGKLDQLMPLLETLEIYEILSLTDIDEQRSDLKRDVRAPARLAREAAAKLRREMNELAAPPAPATLPAAGQGASEQQPSEPPLAEPVIDGAASPELAST